MREQAADRVATALRIRITMGELPPGSRLRDVVLAEEFETSRNTIREALRILRSDGLVSHQMNRGAVVRNLTAENVRDIYLVRRTLEVRAVEESGLARDSTLETVGQAVADAERSVRERAWSEVGTASLAFHQALVALLGSPSLNEFFATTVARLRLAFAVMEDEGAFQLPWVPRDRDIYEALTAGRRGDARQALGAYLDESERTIVDVVRAHNTGQRVGH